MLLLKITNPNLPQGCYNYDTWASSQLPDHLANEINQGLYYFKNIEKAVNRKLQENYLKSLGLAGKSNFQTGRYAIAEQTSLM